MRIMRALQPLVINPALLFFLSLPIPALSDSDLDTSLRAKSCHALIDSSSDETEAKPSTWFSVDKIEEYTHNAFSDLDVTQMALVQPQAITLPDNEGLPSDFWDAVEKYQDTMQDYVHKLLNSAAVSFGSTKFTDIMSVMQDIVNATATFHDSIQETLRTRGITSDMLTEELQGVFMLVANELETRPHPDEAPGCAEWAIIVDNILDKVATELESLFQRLGIEEGVATDYTHAVNPRIQTLVITACEINKQYPHLFSAVAFCVAVLLIPQGWILKPFLSLLGFGPLGPLKGSAAAWLQRYLWGAAVKSGSWFAWLQAAGMGAIPVWAGAVAKAQLLIGGLFAFNVTGFVTEWLQRYF